MKSSIIVVFKYLSWYDITITRTLWECKGVIVCTQIVSYLHNITTSKNRWIKIKLLNIRVKSETFSKSSYVITKPRLISIYLLENIPLALPPSTRNPKCLSFATISRPSACDLTLYDSVFRFLPIFFRISWWIESDDVYKCTRQCKCYK